MKGRWNCLTVAGLCIVIIAAGISCQQKAAKKEVPEIIRMLPSTTLGFIAFTDLDSLREDFKTTALNEIWQDTSLKAWRETSWPKFRSMIDNAMEEAELPPIETLLQGDWVLALIPYVETNPEGEFWGISPVIVIRPTDDPDAVDMMLSTLSSSFEEVYVESVGTFRILGFEEHVTRQLSESMNNAEQSLMATPKGEAIRKSFDPSAFLHVWMDLRGFIGELMDQEMSEEAQLESETMLNEMGLGNISTMYYKMEVKDKGFLSNTAITFDGKRKGICTIPGKPGPFNSVRLCPPDRKLFFAYRLNDFDSILAIVDRIAQTTGQDDIEEWEDMKAEVSEFLGMDFETEFANSIGNEFALSMGPVLFPKPQVTLFVEVKDFPEMDQLLERIFIDMGLSPSTEDYNGNAYKTFSWGNPVCSYGYIDGFLVLANRAEELETAFELKEKGNTLDRNPTFQKAMASGGRNAVSVWFVDPAEWLGSLGVMASSFLVRSLNEEFAAGLTPSDIPNMKVLTEHLPPLYGTFSVTETTLEYSSFSPFPIGIFETALLAKAGTLISMIYFFQPGVLGERGYTDVNTQARMCQENLARIDGAKEQWALENSALNTAITTWSDLVGTDRIGYLKTEPTCPGGGTYTINSVGTYPTCSIGTDAGGSLPHQLP